MTGADDGGSGIHRFPGLLLFFVLFHGFSPRYQYVHIKEHHTSSTEFVATVCRKCKLFPALLRLAAGRGTIFSSVLHFKPEVIFLTYHYGHLLRVLHWCTDQSMTSALESMELTASQGHIMAYLAHRSHPPCPRDIEAEFQLSHPTVSGLLSRMEQKGFIELRTDPDDRRCKRVYVLDKGRQCHELMHQTIQANEKRIVDGFTPEEQALFSQLLQRAITNMGGNPCHRNTKEEKTK